jgi:hypothetical protein
MATGNLKMWNAERGYVTSGNAAPDYFVSWLATGK